MTDSTKTTWHRLIAYGYRIAGTNKFFVLILVLFLVQAGWVAFSSLYPMAFDEDTHLGIIRFFASNPNPFFTTQPSDLNQYGPVVGEVSYLYRYVMTLPWHVITGLTDNFMTQVVAMRFINVAFFAGGLAIFWRTFLLAINNKVIANLTVLLVTLTPITAQLAGQINYDNLFFLLMAAMVFLAQRVLLSLKTSKIKANHLILFISTGLLGSLVKYTFLPIFVALVFYLAWNIYRTFYKNKKAIKTELSSTFNALTMVKRFALVGLLVISFGLFAQRYGGNIINYGTFTPDCVSVIGQENCESYSIYRRGVIYEQSKPATFNKNPLYFSYVWLRHMELNLMSVLNGPHSGYAIGRPLFLPYLGSVIFSVSGIILSVYFWRRLIKSHLYKMTIFISLFYCGLLWILNYSSYLDVGRRVAVQGRYLVPLLPLLYFIFFIALRQVFLHVPKIRLGLTSLIVACFIYGGGALTFILHSDHAWYWPNSTVNSMNESVQKVLRPIIPDSEYTPYWQTSFEF